ncbi:SIR2 family protein [Pseudoduganella danionis]|uniref:Deacetylase sirtuin-type domain-containing protein n=2 Tax=Pseudoduganella danionis TaxID=1890295 RepID=A0ABW9SQB7_9BURK|nr:hypothetical protein [Pseudoduganella danionis]
MIAPIHSLAFSIQANRGVYAVLVGSGISHAAKIPTGWAITLDLVRKLAKVVGEDCGAKPEDWYREKYGCDPDYSELLDAVAKTSAERQQLLRTYWEPTEEERDEGAKQPTAAHRAIAQLVSKGFIKVIVTTNFDRLMETALADVGIVPTILSTADQVHGALPLIHTQCCLFKVHGDYLDTRILNTPEELSAYPVEFDRLLDRIFDEFGLIVCGWSADWDEALRRAITRAPSRRFTTYWAMRGEPSASAQQLIDHRGAQVISIKDADSFFVSVQEQVASLEEFSRPHPLSTEAAVASLKRYMSESKYRIQLSDLVFSELERTIEAIDASGFAVQGGPVPTGETITERVRAYEAACATLAPMAVQAGHWGEAAHTPIWLRVLSALATLHEGGSGYVFWLELQQYPAALLFYALGIGAALSERLDFLSDLFGVTVAREHKEDKAAVKMFAAACLLSNSGGKGLEGMQERFSPLSDWLHDRLKPWCKRIAVTDAQFTMAFDKLEILIALSYGYHSQQSLDSYWAAPPACAYGSRRNNGERIIKEIQQSLDDAGDKSPYVTPRLFGTSAAECKMELEAFSSFIAKLSQRWY